MTAVALELLPVQYGDATGTVITDAAVYVALKRSVRGKWMFTVSDYFPGDGPIWRQRWLTAADALAWLAARDERTVSEVEL